MSINPNKLAFKGSKGPWTVTRKYTQDKCFYIIDDSGERRLAMVDSNVMAPDRIKANAHLISVTPEAVEFIADLLYSLSCDIPKMDIPEMIHRGEEILKKAYNY